jgi:hypothetical protein
LDLSIYPKTRSGLEIYEQQANVVVFVDIGKEGFFFVYRKYDTCCRLDRHKPFGAGKKRRPNLALTIDGRGYDEIKSREEPDCRGRQFIHDHTPKGIRCLCGAKKVLDVQFSAVKDFGHFFRFYERSL